MLPSLFFSEIIQKCTLYTSSILFHKSSLKLRMIQDKKAVFHFARYYIPVKDLCLNKAVLRAKNLEPMYISLDLMAGSVTVRPSQVSGAALLSGLLVQVSSLTTS